MVPPVPFCARLPSPVMVKPPVQLARRIPFRPPEAVTLSRVTVRVPPPRLTATPALLVTAASATVSAPTLVPPNAVPPLLFRLRPRTRLPDASVMPPPAPVIAGRALPVPGSARLPAGGVRPVMADND